jgi:UPF0716 protein FxsA
VNVEQLRPSPLIYVRRLLGYRDRDFLFRTILILLGFSLVPLAEIMLFVFLGQVIGIYLVLIIAVIAGLAGGFAILSQARRMEARLQEVIRAGAWPGRELVDCAGYLAAAVLLITPGFITDVAGLLLLVPPLRRKAGKLLAAKLAAGFSELYDRLELSRL